MTIAPDRPSSTEIKTVWDLDPAEPDWRERAACKEGAPDPLTGEALDPEAFGPRRGNSEPTATAVILCASCPVLMSCRVDACQQGDRATYRGGQTPQERARWLKEQGIRMPGYVSGASQKVIGPRISRRDDVDVARVVRLRQRGLAYADIARVVGCTERTAQRRYTEWKQQQAGGAS